MDYLEWFVEKSIYYPVVGLKYFFWPIKLFKDEMVRRNPQASGIFFGLLAFTLFLALLIALAIPLHREDVKFQEFWDQFATATK